HRRKTLHRTLGAVQHVCQYLAPVVRHILRGRGACEPQHYRGEPDFPQKSVHSVASVLDSTAVFKAAAFGLAGLIASADSTAARASSQSLFFWYAMASRTM